MICMNLAAWWLCSLHAIGLQPTTNPGVTRPEHRAPDAPSIQPPPDPGPQWWDDRVFYEVFVRSFADSTSGPLAGDGIGDIRGLIDKLDTLNDGDPATTRDLGVTGIWLMPIHPSPSYHGYDITDYRAINPRLGTMDDFRELIRKCRDRGIAVMIDLVLNHTSHQHPWFVDALAPGSTRRDWYVWMDEDPGWTGPWDQKVWHASGSTFYYGLFHHTMPDLNFRNPDVTAEALRIIDFWTDDVGVDGLRLDAIRHLIESGTVQENTVETHAWLKAMHAHIKAGRPGTVTIGEVWADSRQAASYVGDELDLTFEFSLAAAMMQAAETGDSTDLMKAERLVMQVYPRGQFGRFLTNHDQPRVMTQLKGDEARARIAAALLLLGPGVPFIYYGEEIGMSGPKPDEKIRTPMQWNAEANAGFTSAAPWQALNADCDTRHVDAMTRDPDSLRSWYGTLIRLRATHPSLARGSAQIIETGARDVYAMIRRTPGSRAVLVLINLGARRHDRLRLGTDGPVRTLHGPEASRLSEIVLLPHECGIFELFE